MIKLGVICPSEIAFRRFMPALQQVKGVEFVGLGVCSLMERFGEIANTNDVMQQEVIAGEYEKAKQFITAYGGKIFESYESIATSDEIDALYVPLPPALHFKWAKLALESGKHVLVEKPSTIHATDTKILVEIAKKNNLALHENYMFIFHNQLNAIEEIIKSGKIGDVRLYRIAFGFPRRAQNDFRYNKSLGGGALIDAGGYTIKYATRLLGPSIKIKDAQMNYLSTDEVDIYGSATLVNKEGTTVQIAYGMDNNYKCELEVWGSKGCLTTGRILTAPAGFVPNVKIRNGNEEETRDLPADDTFKKSIEHFINCVNNVSIREETFNSIIKQAELVDNFKELASNKKDN